MKSEVVVVTGASAGIGRAIVRKFARHGANVGLIARGLDGLNGAKEEVEACGGKACVAPADVSSHDQVETAAQKIEDELGPIDIWVNDAMTSIFSPFVEIRPDEFKRVTEVTYLGTVYGTMAALKRMRPRNRGTIVQIGSALAYRGIPLQSAYCGAKHAIQGFMDSLRCELLHENSGVHVCMVQMPGVNTPQFEWVKSRLRGKPKPVGTIYQPELAADAAYWMAHNRKREMFVGIEAVKAIVGNKVMPGVADHYLAWTGFDSQQRAEPDSPDRPDNLWSPVAGDHGAHGPFDNQAKSFSLQIWADIRKPMLAGAGLLALGLLAISRNLSLGKH